MMTARRPLQPVWDSDSVKKAKPACVSPSPARPVYEEGSVSAADDSKPLLNFGPGPAPMPAAVLQTIQSELLDYRGTGLSVLSMSHRSPEFGEIMAECRAAIRRLLGVPAERGEDEGHDPTVPRNPRAHVAVGEKFLL